MKLAVKMQFPKSVTGYKCIRNKAVAGGKSKIRARLRTGSMFDTWSWSGRLNWAWARVGLLYWGKAGREAR